MCGRGRRERFGRVDRFFFRKNEVYIDGGAKPFGGEAFNFREESVAYPLQHKAVRRRQCHDVFCGLKLERLDPGFKLLGWQLLFEMAETGAPETIHAGATMFFIRGGEKPDARAESLAFLIEVIHKRSGAVRARVRPSCTLTVRGVNGCNRGLFTLLRHRS